MNMKKEMEEIAKETDEEVRHFMADGALCHALEDLGYGEAVAIFDDMNKWYAWQQLKGKEEREMPEGIIISFELIKQLKELKSIDPGLEREYLRRLREKYRQIQRQGMNGPVEGW